MLKDYEHHANYYETDQMGCVHHSNFIRWMEEARIDMMEQIGCGYKSIHCFLDRKGRPISLKRAYPIWDTVFKKTMETQNEPSTERQI